eukprot:2854085-Rhodomonas_salina.1
MCQKKAWMDKQGICMWVELTLKAWLDENECPEWGALLTWDHCGPQMMRAVHETLKALKIWAECLPKNMMDWLQVMDLVVNGPYKSNTCRLRCKDLHEYMQTFRMLFYRTSARQEQAPVWNPPKPKIKQGLRNSMVALQSMDQDANFREGMSKAFVQVGLVPWQGDVVESPERVCFRRWMGADPQAMLSVRASGKLAAVIYHQQQNMLLLGDLIDDCNMVEFNDGDGDVQDEAIFEEDEEEEEEVAEGE